MDEKSISRAWLFERLVRAAQLRSAITMASTLLSVCVVGAIFGELKGNQGVLPALVFVSFPLLVCWVVTVLLCRMMVTCPYCGESLWGCGSGNFKPRRMRVRNDVSHCPKCRARISLI